MKYADKFRTLMIQNRCNMHLSKSDLARMIEMSPSFICDIESSRKNPSFDTAISISKVLGISIDEIFE